MSTAEPDRTDDPHQDRGPQPGPDAGPGAGPGALRRRIEQDSLPVLELLARLPVWLPFLLLLVLILGGGFIGGTVGWVLVGVAMFFVAWLLYLSWPRLTGVERLMRVAVLLLFLAVTVVQLVPRG